MKRFFYSALLLCSLGILVIAGCDDSETSSDATGTGTLAFTANGEGFVHDGFVSEDGWAINFDHVYANIASPTAYQVAQSSSARHAGHAHGDIPDGSAHVTLEGEFFVDLKRQGASSSVFSLGEVNNAAIGNYNYLNFSLKNIHTTGSGAVTPSKVLNDGDTRDPSDYEGYCLILIGTATKSGEAAVNFTFKFNQQMKFTSCGPQEDLDENGTADGILASGSNAKTQMTFHFDHVFGDKEEVDNGIPADTKDPTAMNFWGIGFEPFKDVGSSLTQAQMASGMTDHVYFHLYSTLKTLAHLGEAHCSSQTF